MRSRSDLRLLVAIELHVAQNRMPPDCLRLCVWWNASAHSGVGVLASCGFRAVGGPVVSAAVSALASLRAKSPLALMRLVVSFSMSLALLARGILWAGSGSSTALIAREALISSASILEMEGRSVGGVEMWGVLCG